MDEEHLALQDINGNTALCIAAAAGSIEIVQILIQHNDSLLKIRGGKDMAPPYMAAVLGQSEMAWYLYHESKTILEKTDSENLFFSCINNCLYGRYTKEPIFFIFWFFFNLEKNDGTRSFVYMHLNIYGCRKE